ncbi:MAG: type IV pilin accessory protein, partial [Gammaproteobacteria bacterium]|nr:type IV pilin accessory protein [Gammaproteobacteria bacterium]
MSRSRAFLYHLAGTVAVLVLLSLAVRLAWFPEPYGRGLGLVRLLGMLWLLQITTGPLLTLLLYRPGKRGLKFDMALVALLQAGTLAIALWMIVQARPVFVVFAVDRFEVV